MSRDGTPVWIRRRIERRLARGGGNTASVRVALNNLRQRRAIKEGEDLPENVIPFPGIATLRVLELATA
jgi:hypothetical protein